MRAVTGTPWRALHQGGAAVARRWRGWHAGRRIVALIEREPTSGCVGTAFMACAVLGLGALYLARHFVPFVADLAREIAVIGITGIVLFAWARLARRRRR